MEGWKKWYIWIVAVFLLTAVVGKVIMARIPDVGLAGVKTIDELSERQVKLEYALGDGERSTCQIAYKKSGRVCMSGRRGRYYCVG